VPSVLLLTGILFAIFYPLNRSSYAKTREEIAARHEIQPGV
jgi:Na+/melibiose symporter-like transporter